MSPPLAFLHFDDPLWVYVSIPLTAALVGWFTKLVAIRMMFEPLEFRGIRPVFGWQGQIPKRAPKMAAIAVDSVTREVLRPEDLFDRIDPDELVAQLEEHIAEASHEIVETLMTAYQPAVWSATPERVKRLVVSRVHASAPGAARHMYEELRRNLDEVFDLKHMVVSNLIRDKVLLNAMFKEIGRDAFRFLVRCGLIFGFYIGLVQTLAYGATGSELILPIFGLITGGLTDYIALTMIFRPKHPRRIAPGIQWQGLFHAKREQVTRDYATLLAKDILTPAAVLDSLLTGPQSDRFFALVSDEIARAIDEQTGVARPIITRFAGRQYQDVKRLVAARVIDRIPAAAPEVEAYAAERLDIAETMIEKMRELDTDSYEGLLRPAFKDDEWVVVALGATLGFLFGELQVHLITALA